MQIDIGSVYDGTVTGLTKFGAFVKLENGVSGMVHISEVSNEYVNDISEHLSEGDTVKVKVLEINDKGKISLSIKKALPQEEKPKPQKPSRPRRENNENRGWKGAPQQDNSAPMSFEDMMARFKQVSDEKMTDLKRASDSKRGSGGYSRRGTK